MKHREIMKLRDYWTWLNMVADRQEQHEKDTNGDVFGKAFPAGPTDKAKPFAHDGTVNGAFADWLEERGSPLGHVVRHAEVEPDYRHGETHSFDWGNPPPLYKTYDYLSSRHGQVPIHWPGTDGVELGSHNGRPVLQWMVYVPRKVSTTGTHRMVTYTAPVDSDTLTHFLRGLPRPHTLTNQWVFAARRQGMIPSRQGDPTKLARIEPNRTGGTGGAVADLNTKNTDKLRDVALSILREAGLTPALVRNVLVHNGQSTRAGVLQAITKQIPPQLARYVGAWFGLLAREKAVTVFHPDQQGSDYMHVLTSGLPTDKMGDLLRRSGVSQFLIEQHPTGSRTYVFDPQGKLSDRVNRVTGAINAKYSAFRGSGFRIGNGASTNADSRTNFRNVISDAERSTPSATTASSSAPA